MFSGTKLTAKGKSLRFVAPVIKDGKPHAVLQQSELDSIVLTYLCIVGLRTHLVG